MGGELATRMITTTKKKKKKGRPSLLDLERRSIKKQQQQQNQFRNTNPKSVFKSSSQPTPHQTPTFASNNDDNYDHQDDDDDERQQKKHRPLHGLESFAGLTSVSDGQHKIHTGSDILEEKVLKATITLHGSPGESAGPTTPLPDKKLLVFVLDRLQKKDTYGVFSEPVDPEELPDYLDIIKHPIDFATVRKKLDAGAYVYLEDFEKDVFLICTNAMQYNAPDTIYFRQARSIIELAKKDFKSLRQDSDDSEPQIQSKVVRRGRPPKNLKKSLDSCPTDRLASEFVSDATLANGADNSSCASAHNLRKGPITSVRFWPPDAATRVSHGSHVVETNTSWLSEWENEFPASVVKGVLKYGKKHFKVDENRRDTYKDSMAAGQESSVLATFEEELKQLMVVGLNSEHSYARSLARFAADLGPVVWKIASKKINSVLPIGVNFGPGWVGENKPTEQQQYFCIGKQKSSNKCISGYDHLSRLMSPTTSSSNSPAGNSYYSRSAEEVEAVKEVNPQNNSSIQDSTGVSQIQSRPFTHPNIIGFSSGNGSCSRGFEFNYPAHVGTMGLGRARGNSRSDNSIVPCQMFGMVVNNEQGFSSVPMPAGGYDSNAAGKTQDARLLGDLSCRGLSTLNKQEYYTFAPDLNVRSLAPDSPISDRQVRSPQQQPDLALQL